MIEALHCGREPPHAVKALAALAGVDGIAQRLGFEKIRLFEAGTARHSGWAAFIGSIGTDRANLSRQTHFDHMAGFGAFHQAQNAQTDEAADGLTHGPAGNAHAAGEPSDGKVEPELPFEAAVAQEMRIDSAVDDRQAKLRNDEVFQLFPDEFSIRFFVFHGLDPERAGTRAALLQTKSWDTWRKEKKYRSGRRTAAERGRTVNVALSEGAEPERAGQATRKKVKGKLSGDNLPQDYDARLAALCKRNFSLV
jgi:hypothetical protein